MSVKDAVQELRTATVFNKHNAIPAARLCPDWGQVHREDQIRRTGHSSLPSADERSATAPPMRAASGRGGDNWATQSSTSSVPYRYQERQTPGGGCASPSGLNSAYTYYYGTEPLNPAATNNEANRVGSLSMFGSQAISGKVSSGSFGFGTATREQAGELYISPAHLRANLCKFSPGPATYGATTSLNRQVPPPLPPTTPLLPLPPDTLPHAPQPPAPLCPSHADLLTQPRPPVRAALISLPCAHAAAPAGAQLEALLPVGLLWPRGALRPTPPLCSCNLHAGPRCLPCLSSVVVRATPADPCRASCASCACGPVAHPLQPRRAVLWQQPQRSPAPRRDPVFTRIFSEALTGYSHFGGRVNRFV